MEGREIQHLFHEHPLILKVEQLKSNDGDHPEAGINCSGCSTSISGPFYSCVECRYFLHKVCAELPSELEHPLHPQHPLTLLESSPYADSSYYICDSCGREYSTGESRFVYHCSICALGKTRFDVDMKCASATHKIKDKCHPHPLTVLHFPIVFTCHICRKKEEGLSYKCYSCPFWVHQNCTLLADKFEHSHLEDPYPFVKLQHFSHDHPLILLSNERETEDGISYSNIKLCYGCRIQIVGPFYSCGECRYFLHKLCAELPRALDHPLHPQHPLVLLQRPLGSFECSLCRETWSKRMVYYCSTCEFYVDVKCASATLLIQENCHPHPLTPSQVPNSFPCHVCLVEDKGPSYRCNICPFGVHQNCTLMPNTVKHSYHGHLLKLFRSIPFEYCKVSKYCDICHSKLFMFQCIYGCGRCLFFAHVSCARSETRQSLSMSRDQISDGQSLILLPMKQDSTDLLSRFVRTFSDEDANIDNKIDHFDHEHPLFLMDEKTTDNKTCEACAIRISPPSYGCVECDYFLHKCCTDLPKQITHPLHPQHQLALRRPQGFIICKCCGQFCSSMFYECSECEDYDMDIKCASIMQGTVYYEAHRHPLFPRINDPRTYCTSCGWAPYSGYTLKCNTCSFELCFECAMAPPVIRHRYGKSEPFKLTYSPPENHYDEYICEICLEELNPKRWYYHCVFADQFTHVRCMLLNGADSNIKYGKSHMVERIHKHKVITISCTYDCTLCSYCRQPLRSGFSVGQECIPCNFRIHLRCRPNQARFKGG